MIKYRNAVEFVRGIWLLAQSGATAEEVRSSILALLNQREYDKSEQTKRANERDLAVYNVRRGWPAQEFEWKGGIYSGIYAHMRRLGLLPAVISALVSTAEESTEQMKRRFALFNVVSSIRGWGWNDSPVEVRYLTYVGLGLKREHHIMRDAFSHWDLVAGRYDVTHPYLKTSNREKVWPGNDKVDIWQSLWLLTHCSGQKQNGLKAYGQLAYAKDQVIELGLASAVAQNLCEALIPMGDPLRQEPLGLHETSRFCGLYMALRLAYPDITRLQAEKAVGYPNQNFVNHWSVARVLSQIEEDWLS